MPGSSQKSNRRRRRTRGPGLQHQAGRGGVNVDLFSMVPVEAQPQRLRRGINACNEIARQQGYSEWIHFDETVLGGDFLADQPPVLEMCNWAPQHHRSAHRMGVPFNRTPEGQRALRLFGGSLVNALSSPAPPRASKCSTPSTNKPAAGKPKAWSKIRILGIPLACSSTTAPASASSPRICAPCRSALSAPTPSSWPPADTD